MKRIMVTGALGQIGSELTGALRARYGAENVLATDVRKPAEDFGEGPFELLDATDAASLDHAVQRYEIDTIFHLASLLSASAEASPMRAWDLNMGSLIAVLEVARARQCAVFNPSSIGAFGPGTPSMNTPQDTVQRPTSMYGITKVAGELLCDYYFKKYGVDTRGLRYPGLISYATPPGGGTTDYAVDIYYKAIESGRFTSFLRAGTRLDMMYMPDALDAAIHVMEADPARLTHRNAFNVTAMSFAPEEVAAAIREHIPGFELDFDVDLVRQGIADSWPDHMDDSAARAEWGWSPRYDLAAMTQDMLAKLRERSAHAP